MVAGREIGKQRLMCGRRRKWSAVDGGVGTEPALEDVEDEPGGAAEAEGAGAD